MSIRGKDLESLYENSYNCHREYHSSALFKLLTMYSA